MKAPAVVTREAVLDTLRAYGTWASIPEVAEVDVVPLGRHHRRDGTGAYVVRDAGPLACGVLALPPCPCPPVVAVYGMFSGLQFCVCHRHQARVLGPRRWLTTTVTRDPATIVDGSTRRARVVRVPQIGG